ncbi:hypothetical protein RB653_003789 [Dictyostelium firmibasis]|uniref:Cytochrome P450 n=1 Tax=Dictyostelium firmibasis TaxID=79012 RepID=A0AAN7U6B7_9MYCE
MDYLNSYFIFIIIFLVYSFVKKNKKDTKGNSLKGPIALPIIGNLLGLRNNPYSIMDYYHKKYGGIYRLWFGDYVVVTLNDPEIIREIFVKNYSNFSSRPVLPTITFGSFNYRGISGSNGDCWRRNRNLLLNAMKKSNLKQTYDNLGDSVNSLIKLMYRFQASNECFQPDMYLRKYALTTMFKYVFNETVSFESKQVEGEEAELIDNINEAFNFMTLGNAGDFFRILQPLYHKYLLYSGGCFNRIRSLIRDRYIEHRKTIDEEKPRDLLDLLIIEYGEHTEENLISIVQVCFDVILAGVDTLASSLEWFLLLLCNNQMIQEDVYQELKSTLGNDRSFLTLNDRPSTPFTMACIKETIRLKAPAPFGLPHTTDEDTIIKGFLIPKGAMILINYYSLGRNPKDFPNPLVFDPNRFIGATPDSFMPFGVGPRNCIGQALGMDQIYLLLSNIFFNFKVISDDGRKLDDTDYVSGLNLKPAKYRVFLEKR